jgi:hypothetical protein
MLMRSHKLDDVAVLVGRSSQYRDEFGAKTKCGCWRRGELNCTRLQGVQNANGKNVVGQGMDNKYKQRRSVHFSHFKYVESPPP